MAFRIIYSRKFLEKVLSWKPELQAMAFEAAEHTAKDPDHNDYKRTYLTPYRQRHPTKDHQYTLYFIPVSKTEIFFAWINDPSCLHDTRANYPDPCFKEFERLKGRGDLEIYDPAIHEVLFDVEPDARRPFRCRSTYLHQKTTLNTYLAAPGEFVGHAFHCREQNPQIADLHVREFLRLLHEHLTKAGVSLQVQFTKLGHDAEADRLTRMHDARQWQIIDDAEDFILRKI